MLGSWCVAGPLAVRAEPDVLGAFSRWLIPTGRPAFVLSGTCGCSVRGPRGPRHEGGRLLRTEAVSWLASVHAAISVAEGLPPLNAGRRHRLDPDAARLGEPARPAVSVLGAVQYGQRFAGHGAVIDGAIWQLEAAGRDPLVRPVRGRGGVAHIVLFSAGYGRAGRSGAPTGTAKTPPGRSALSTPANSAGRFCAQEVPERSKADRQVEPPAGQGAGVGPYPPGACRC